MTSISDFMGNFQGLARPNRFRVLLNYPGAVGQPGTRSQFIVSAAALPASRLGSIPVNYMGRIVPLPGDREFEDWTVTIRNDASFDHRNAMEKWSNTINSHQGNLRLNEDYWQTATVHQLALNADRVLKGYTFYNLWPTSVGQIDLSMDSSNQIETFQVTFKFTHWESNSTT